MITARFIDGPWVTRVVHLASPHPSILVGSVPIVRYPVDSVEHTIGAALLGEYEYRPRTDDATGETDHAYVWIPWTGPAVMKVMKKENEG